MNSLNTVSTFLILFFFSLIFLLLIRNVAVKIGLVDKPNYRKRHQGVIPLVGGISIYAGICCYFFFYWTQVEYSLTYLLCAGTLVIIGGFDDRFDISVKIRALIQAIIAIIMMTIAGLSLRHFGKIIGPWELELGWFGYLITLLAVWAAINAFNMVDGIDGLLGGLSSVSFAATGILLYMDGQFVLSGWCLAVIVATMPYLLFNLGVFGKRNKVFMGDAGSTLIGFTIIWILLQGTQGEGHTMNPVTALWVIAIPLIDMIAIMYRRLRQGASPFAADRQHIHHLVMRSGFTSRQAFVLITGAAVLLASVGILGEYFMVPEWLMLVFFLLTFILYDYCLKHAWRLARFIKRLRRSKTIKNKTH